MILGLKKRKSVTVSTFSPCIYHEVMGKDAMILVFLMFSFKSTFSLRSFTFIKRFFIPLHFLQFISVQLLNCLRLFVAPWTAACPDFLSITNSRSLLKLTSIKSVMPSNHLILSSPCPPVFNLSQHQGVFQ